MQIASSPSLHSPTPIAAAYAPEGAAAGDSPKQKLTNLRLEEMLKLIVECTLDADNALELMQVKDLNGALDIAKKVPVDLKQIRKMRIPVEDAGVENNSNLVAPAGVSADSGLSRQHVERLTRDTQLLDGLMDRLSK